MEMVGLYAACWCGVQVQSTQETRALMPAYHPASDRRATVVTGKRWRCGTPPGEIIASIEERNVAPPESLKRS